LTIIEQFMVLTNKEARRALAALSHLDPLFAKGLYADVAYSEIRAKVRAGIIKNHHRIRHEIFSGRSPKEICLTAIAVTASDDIKSGHNHSYPGKLSGIGSGKQSVFMIAMSECVKDGFCSQDVFDARLQELREATKAAG
jgi:hypothetical protein